MKARSHREEIITITVNGNKVPKRVFRDELVIASSDGTEVAFDVGDPYNRRILGSIEDAEKNRKAAEKERHDRRLKTFAHLGVAGLSAFVIFAAVNVYSMGGGNERAKPLGDANEQVEQELSAEHIEFSDLTVYGEKDVWYYIEQYAAIKQMSVIQALDIVTKANPGIDFHKIQKGEKIKVPSI